MFAGVNVAVDDRQRVTVRRLRLVRVMQRLRRGRDDREHVLERKGTFFFVSSASKVRTSRTVDVFHREVRHAAVVADVLHLDDVVVVQRSGEARSVMKLLGMDP